jgi:hypothetical protein
VPPRALALIHTEGYTPGAAHGGCRASGPLTSSADTLARGPAGRLEGVPGAATRPGTPPTYRRLHAGGSPRRACGRHLALGPLRGLRLCRPWGGVSRPKPFLQFAMQTNLSGFGAALRSPSRRAPSCTLAGGYVRGRPHLRGGPVLSRALPRGCYSPPSHIS